jgi:ABC-type multidrug transport system fused ATPase/permease subunit
LDPFGISEDAILNGALETSGLFALQKDLPEQERINLDTEIAVGGKNLSIGQRQIVALARAIVRESKLMIMDEATSAIGTVHGRGQNRTSELRRLCFILSTDPGLQLVLDAGRMVEFDTPKALLDKEQGRFKALVNSSLDKEALYAMVGVRT